MTPARSRGLRKATRDALQAVLAVLAAGGATAVIELLVDSVAPTYSIILAFVFKILIAYAQNYLETQGSIPTFLPTPGLITQTPGKRVTKTVGVLADTKGTVDAAASQTGKIAGDVVDTGGDIVGDVTGQLDDVVGGTVSGVGKVIGGVTGSDPPEER